MKQCTQCKKWKNPYEFYNQKKGKNGKMAWCKDCCKRESKKYRIENREKISESGKRYREANKEAIHIQDKEYRSRESSKELARKRALKSYYKDIEASREKTREWYKNNTEKAKKKSRKHRLKKTYDITIEEYDEMYNAIEGKCQICNEYHENLHIDHNHETGEVRGLLCSNCNIGIGYLRENKEIFINAMKYLGIEK